MDSKTKDAIERLKELEITDGATWFPTADAAFDTQSLDKVAQFNNYYEAIFICALRNEAPPLIEALAAENKRLEAERDALQKRVDGALQSLSFFCSIADKVEQVKLALYGIPTVLGAIEILKGESDV